MATPHRAGAASELEVTVLHGGTAVEGLARRGHGDRPVRAEGGRQRQ
ncbi:hypothetical protein ACIGO6_08925 [Streptomyces sp. NPDC053750]